MEGWGFQSQGTCPMPTSSLCRPGQGQVRPGARFLLLTLDPEEEAVRGALTSGQTDAKGSPLRKWPKEGSGKGPLWESWEVWEGSQD